MQEPSVLDYLKSIILPWKYPAIQLDTGEKQTTGGVADDNLEKLAIQEGKQPGPPNNRMSIDARADQDNQGEAKPGFSIVENGPGERRADPLKPAHSSTAWPWLSFLATALALLGQASLGPSPERDWTAGVLFLVVALASAGLATWRGEWKLSPPPPGRHATEQVKIKPLDLAFGILIAVIAFISFGNLNLTVLNLGLLFIALFFTIRAFWVASSSKPSKTGILTILRKVHTLTIQPEDAKRWFGKAALVIVAIGVVTFFRFSNLDTTPPEMNSDHAEKILDIAKILEGHTWIFFPNNGGREPLQMYLAAGLHKLLNIPLGFDLLKISTTLVGFLSLPFIYLLGKEIGGRRVAFLAFLFAGIAYWPNVVSRAGLRLPFYLLFTASTLYFLLRGFRHGSRNDFILAGISLGLSLYGYSADRILPILVLLLFGLFFIHPHTREKKASLVISLLAIILVSVVIFLPMFRYIIAQPDSFLYRMVSRMVGVEQPIVQSPLLIFFENLANALSMFSWSAGVIWPVSIPNYPALGIASGALFYLGFVLVLIRYVHKRNWLDLFLLLSIPVLLLPSILALAFPVENPNLYRTGGASIPVFILVALALDGLISTFQNRFPKSTGQWLGWSLAVVFFILSAVQDYDWVFNKYTQQYRQAAWNASEMGTVVENFAQLTGSADTAWVMGMPHWVDTRLVAIQAGFPDRDFALFIEQLPETQDDPRAKLFIVRPDDQQSIENLPQIYPHGWFQPFRSSIAETKDFLMYIVPAKMIP